VAKPTIGVDLGGTNIRFGLVSDAGEVSARTQCSTLGHEGAARTLQKILDGIGDTLAQAPRGVRGIGIGSPGPLDSRRGVVITSPNIPGWRNIKLKALVEKRFGLPCKVENDANCAALAEHWVGAGRGVQDMLHYTLGTGVGGGAIVAGELLQGRDSTGGELGHVTVDPDGLVCGCGNRGCVETYASATWMVRRFEQRLRAGKPSVLLDEWRAGRLAITARVSQEAAERGDRAARELVEEAGRYLGIGVASMIVAFNPAVVSFSGGVARFGELLFGPMRAEIKRRAFRSMTRGLRIVRSRLGDKGGVIGAARALMLELERSRAKKRRLPAKSHS
jgi:glucokinase